MENEKNGNVTETNNNNQQPSNMLQLMKYTVVQIYFYLMGPNSGLKPSMEWDGNSRSWIKTGAHEINPGQIKLGFDLLREDGQTETRHWKANAEWSKKISEILSVSSSAVVGLADSLIATLDGYRKGKEYEGKSLDLQADIIGLLQRGIQKCIDPSEWEEKLRGMMKITEGDVIDLNTEVDYIPAGQIFAREHLPQQKRHYAPRRDPKPRKEIEPGAPMGKLGSLFPKKEVVEERDGQ